MRLSQKKKKAIKVINSEWKEVTTYQMNLIIQSSQPKFYKADHFLHKTQISQTLSSNMLLCSATRKLEIIDIKNVMHFRGHQFPSMTFPPCVDRGHQYTCLTGTSWTQMCIESA